MKKLLLLAALGAGAAGAFVVAKSKSEQLKNAAASLTGDPRVQSALATAEPYVSNLGAAVNTTTAAASSYAAEKLGRTPPPVVVESIPDPPPTAPVEPAAPTDEDSGR